MDLPPVARTERDSLQSRLEPWVAERIMTDGGRKCPRSPPGGSTRSKGGTQDEGLK